MGEARKSDYDRTEEALKQFVDIVGEQTRVVVYLPPPIFDKLRHPAATRRATRYDARGISKGAIVMGNITIIGDQSLDNADRDEAGGVRI